MPRRAHWSSSGSLLEREAAMLTLRNVIAATADGNGGVVVIEADAGLGKTALLDAARTLALPSLRVLEARAGEFEQDFAFNLVRQLFEPLLASMNDPERDELLAGAAQLSRPVFDARQMDRPSEGGDVSFATLHGLYWLAANAAQRHPTALLIDDLHWGDTPSLRAITYLARRLEDLPLLVVVATRPAREAREPAFITDVQRAANVIVLRPAPLGRASIAMLLAEGLDATPDPEFVAACERSTGGNPLFVRGLVDTLRAEGLEPTDAHADRVLGIGVRGVSESVSQRVRSLGDAASEVVRAAAVLGDGAPIQQVAILAGLAVPAAARHADQLERVGVLRSADRVEFSHPVVRSAVYDDIPLDLRSEAHRRAANMLADAGAPLEQVASHLVMTLPADDALSVTTLLRAAQRLVAEGAPQQACTLLRRALQERPSREMRAVLHRELGLAELNVDPFAAVDDLRIALEFTEAPAERARTALIYSRALEFIDRFSVAADAVRGAMDTLGTDDRVLRLQLEGALVECSFWDPALRAEGRRHMAALDPTELRQHSDTRFMLAELAFSAACDGDERANCIELALEVARDPKHLRGGVTFAAGLSAAVALTFAGELATARSLYDAAVLDARQRGDMVSLVPLLLLRSLVALHSGDLLKAEEDLRSDEVEPATSVSMTASYRVGFLVDLLIERGAITEAQQVLDSVRPDQQIHAGYRPFYLFARGRLALTSGRVAEAIAELRGLGEYMDALGNLNPSFVPWRSELAMALQRAGHGREAERLAAGELELAERWGAARAIGIARRAMALLAAGRERQERLRHALAAVDGSSAQLERARILVDLGTVVLRDHRRSEACDLLRQGLDFATRLGASALARRARDELVAAGARPRTFALTGVEALTPSERRVARLAADGRSNREIAQALFVTVKAVEVHLTNAYHKLAVKGRSQLPDVLEQRTAE